MPMTVRTSLAASSTKLLALDDTSSTMGFNCLTPSASAVFTCDETSPAIGSSFFAKSCAIGLTLSCTAWFRAGFSSAAVLSTKLLASDATWLAAVCCTGAAGVGAGVAGAAAGACLIQKVSQTCSENACNRRALPHANPVSRHRTRVRVKTRRISTQKYVSS